MRAAGGRPYSSIHTVPWSWWRDAAAALAESLKTACHIRTDDKVGFDFAILDKIDELEAERDKLAERLRAAEKLAEACSNLDFSFDRVQREIIRLEFDKALAAYHATK